MYTCVNAYEYTDSSYLLYVCMVTCIRKSSYSPPAQPAAATCPLSPLVLLLLLLFLLLLFLLLDVGIFAEHVLLVS